MGCRFQRHRAIGPPGGGGAGLLQAPTDERLRQPARPLHTLHLLLLLLLPFLCAGERLLPFLRGLPPPPPLGYLAEIAVAEYEQRTAQPPVETLVIDLRVEAAPSSSPRRSRSRSRTPRRGHLNIEA